MELTLEQLYQKMRQEMGPSGWWPADSKAEIIIDAIMIQNTNWQNAARAVANFRQASEFLPARIQQLPLEQIQDLTRPAGFYRNKSRAVQAVFAWLSQYGFDYQRIVAENGDQLRDQLLTLHGIGEETADVLLNFVFGIPTFVSDKYARTLFTHLGITGLTNYRSLAKRCWLSAYFDLARAQDFHGLIDEFGKQYLRSPGRFQESFLAGDRLVLG